VLACVFSAAAVRQSSFAASSTFFRGLPEEDWDLFLYSLAPRNQSPEESRQRVELLKQAYTAQDFLIKIRAATGSEGVEHLLGDLKAPVLVLHARDYALLNVAEPMKLARLVRGHLVLIDGSTALGDAEQGLRAVDKFFADLPVAGTPGPAPDSGLSIREEEVLRLVAAGRSNQQIADELVISVNTVIRHVSTVFGKTGVTNRVEAATYARDHGIA
jgi:DNA-binding CsgD family transcriptional regulator